MVEPSDEHSRLTNSDDVKAQLIKAVDPRKLSLRIDEVVETRNKFTDTSYRKLMNVLKQILS